MDRNNPLIGGRLEIEGAAAFARNMRQIERSMKSLNDTMQIVAAEGLNRRLGAVATSFDKMAVASSRAARSMAAVNLQVASLGRRTATINKLAASIAAMNAAGAIGGGGNRGVSNAALLGAILSRPGGGGGAGAAGATALSSQLTLSAADATTRRLNAAKMAADITSAKQQVALAQRTANQKAAIDAKYAAQLAAATARIHRAQEAAAARSARNIEIARAASLRRQQIIMNNLTRPAAAMAGGGAAGGGRGGGASRQTDFIPGVGLGSTAYFRGNIGPAAIYTRLPLTLNAVGAAAVIATAAITALGAQFQKTANDAKVFGGETVRTEARLKGISAVAISLSRDFTTSANDVLKGAVALGKAGAPIGDLSNDLIKTATLFAQASRGELEVTEASDILVQTLTSQKLAWSEAMNVADAYTGVIQNSTAKFADLGPVMAQLLPIASTLGIGYKELAVTYGVLRDAGLSSSVASTALKNSLLAISDPSKDAQEILEKYNISLFGTNKEVLPLIEVIGRLTDAFGDNAEGASDAQKFFDLTDIATTRTILGLSALSKQGPEAFAKLHQAASVSTEQIARDLQDNLIDQLGIFVNQVSAAAIAVGSQFVPQLTNMATAANAAIRGDTLGAFEELGRKIGSIMTLNDQFTRDFIMAFGPGPVAAVNTLANIISGNLDPNIRTLQSTIITFGKAFSTAFIAGSVAVQIAHEQIAKLNAADTFNNKAQLENNAAIIGFIERTSNALLQTLIRNVAAGAAAIEFYKQRLADPTNFEGLNKSFDQLFQESLAHLNTQFEMLESGIGAAATNTGNVMVDIVAEFGARMDSVMAAVTAQISAGVAQVQAAALPAMSNSMGFWDLPHVLPKYGGSPAPPARVFGGSTFPPSGGGGGGGAPAAPNLDDITAQVKELLVSVPGLTDDLFRFIAGLAQDVPARLMPMVNAIKASREQVGQLLVSKQGLLTIDIQLLASSRRLAGLQAEMGRIEIEQALAVIEYDKQLLGLRQQLLEVDARMQPLQDRLTQLDRESAKLQQENLVLARQRIAVELEILPIRAQVEALDREIAELGRVNYSLGIKRLHIEFQLLGPKREISLIDREIEKLNRKNFDLERQRIKGEMEALPIRLQIRDIEDAITDSIDRRAGIQRQLAELDQADVADELAAAWERMDVPAIIRLEEQKRLLDEKLKKDDKAERVAERARLGLELEKIALEDTLKPIERRLRAIEDTNIQTGLLNELTLLGLEEQKRAYEDIVLAAQDRLDQLSFEEETRRILNEATALGLEAEKQTLIDILLPMETKLEAINREIETERLRNEALMTHIEAERREIIAQLQPLEDERRAIERIMQQVDLLRARANLEFEERKIGIQEMILQEQLRQAELEATRKEQELLFFQLLQGFTDSLIASQAFTAEEALEVAKRGKLWDQSVAELFEVKLEFDRVSGAAKQYQKDLDAITRNIQIVITTVHRTVYESGPAPASGTTPNDADVGSETAAVASAQRASMSAGPVTNQTTNNYNVDANYSQVQSPAGIRDDLRAVIMMSAT